MQLARLLLSLGVLLASGALAAQGDGLLVTGSNVNVRAGPSTDAGVLIQVGINERAVEVGRQGQWVEVELPDQDVLGWIHGSLLTVAPSQTTAGSEQGGQQQEPAKTAGDVAALDESATGTTQRAAVRPALDAAATPLERFRREVEYFNDRAVAAAGVDLFTGVAPLEDDGGVQVVATDAWATMPPPGQESFLNALFGSWQAAIGREEPLRLQIVDPNGAVMMEKTGP